MFAFRLSPLKIESLSFYNTLLLRNSFKFQEQHATISNKFFKTNDVPKPPKKPPTPYIKYVQLRRPYILETQPNLSAQDIIKVIAAEWAEYDPEKKKLLQKEYLQEMEKYSLVREKYLKSLTHEQKLLIEEAKQKEKKAEAKAILIEKGQDLGKPKRPPSSFLRFMMEKMQKKDTDIKHTEWIKNVAKEWGTTSEDAKAKYHKETQAALDKYKIDLLAWEESMIRQGHVDVVKNKQLLNIDKAKIKKQTV